jgi:hypothetical protein
MAIEKPSNNYQPLDQLLTEYLDAQSLGNELDAIMNDLVCYAGCDKDYSSHDLECRYHILRLLRDLFWKLEKPTHHE